MYWNSISARSKDSVSVLVPARINSIPTGTKVIVANRTNLFRNIYICIYIRYSAGNSLLTVLNDWKIRAKLMIGRSEQDVLQCSMIWKIRARCIAVLNDWKIRARCIYFYFRISPDEPFLR